MSQVYVHISLIQYSVCMYVYVHNLFASSQLPEHLSPEHRSKFIGRGQSTQSSMMLEMNFFRTTLRLSLHALSAVSSTWMPRQIALLRKHFVLSVHGQVRALVSVSKLGVIKIRYDN